MEKDSSNNLPEVFVPTQKQLVYLEWLQNNDNVKLDGIRENIGQAVCIIARMIYDVDNDDVADEANLIIQRLGYFHYELKNLES